VKACVALCDDLLIGTFPLHDRMRTNGKNLKKIGRFQFGFYVYYRGEKLNTLRRKQEL
jgi:hypothetical protein